MRFNVILTLSSTHPRNTIHAAHFSVLLVVVSLWLSGSLAVLGAQNMQGVFRILCETYFLRRRLHSCSCVFSTTRRYHRHVYFCVGPRNFLTPALPIRLNSSHLVERNGPLSRYKSLLSPGNYLWYSSLYNQAGLVRQHLIRGRGVRFSFSTVSTRASDNKFRRFLCIRIPFVYVFPFFDLLHELCLLQALLLSSLFATEIRVSVYVTY